jgi:hypothetical protein
MKTWTISAISCSALLALLAPTLAHADEIWDFTFIGSGITATGSIDESGGHISSGSIDLTGSGLNGVFNFLPAASAPGTTTYEITGGPTADLIVDNNFSPLAPIFDSTGVGFGQDQTGPTTYVNGINIWSNSTTDYTSFEVGAPNEYNGFDVQLTSLTEASVPERAEGWTILEAILGLACFGFAASRRKPVMV